MAGSAQQSNEANVTTRLIELLNNLSERQQQALLSMLLDLIEKVETYYLNFLEWKETADFQPSYAEVHLVSEKYQFGHYLIECVVTGITPDTSEYGEDWHHEHRREEPRTPCSIAVHYATKDRAFKDFIKNMSARGAFIETGIPFSVGQEITLTFSSSNDEDPVKITGGVAWSGPRGIGVKFKKATQAQYVKAMAKSLHSSVSV